MHKHHCQIQTITSGGYCFLNAIELAKYSDHDEGLTVDEIVHIILVHLTANNDDYKGFHSSDILMEAEMYFKFGTYNKSDINIIIIATAYALD